MARVFGVEVVAVSVGGLETCIELPQWDLCFDIGRCPPSAVRRGRVAITHAHMDHAGGLAYHASMRDLLGMGTPTYFVPRPNLADFEQLLEVWRRLDRSDVAASLVGLEPGQRVELGGNRFLEPFRSPHRVYCQGYAVGTRRRKLRAEFAESTPQEIGRARAQGVEVTEEVDVIEVAFTGDTTIEVLDTNDLVRRARLLIMEVTFVGGEVTPARAHAKGHVHLEDVVRRAADFEHNQGLLFTHFSARHSRGEIVNALDTRLPGDLRRRVVALPELAPEPLTTP